MSICSQGRLRGPVDGLLNGLLANLEDQLVDLPAYVGVAGLPGEASSLSVRLSALNSGSARPSG